MELQAAARLRADREILAKQRTPQEIKALPTFRIALADDVFKLTDEAYVDNRDGLGATPDNRNVRYKGFVALLSPEVFLKLAPPSGDLARRADNMADLIRQGYGIGNPCIYLEAGEYLDGSAPLRVTGHEGRARVTCLAKHFGLKQLPIQFFPISYRARHFPDHEELLDDLNTGIITETGATLKNGFKTILFA